MRLHRLFTVADALAVEDRGSQRRGAGVHVNRGTTREVKGVLITEIHAQDVEIVVGEHREESFAEYPVRYRAVH